MVLRLKTIALFAPPNCTGNSGVIGDTILQTSLVRTLLDRSLFPDLQQIHWWGAKWVVEELFGYFKPYVECRDWDGSPGNLPSAEDLRNHQFDAALICTREAAVIERIKSLMGTVPSYTPARPLRAQSSVHLYRQLHSSLIGLGLDVTDVPSPRIPVGQEALDRARANTTRERLVAASSERTIGKQDFDPEVDQLFLLVPAVGALDDARTWSRDSWASLVRTLSEVGVVVVYYNPKDSAQRQAAGFMVSGPQSFKSRFAIGLSLPELATWACLSTVTTPITFLDGRRKNKTTTEADPSRNGPRDQQFRHRPTPRRSVRGIVELPES